MKDFFEIFLLSIIQGVSEFLPVSSTAHLILASKIYEFENLDNLSNYINKLKISNLSNTLDLSREILDYLQKNRKEIKLFFK